MEWREGRKRALTSRIAIQVGHRLQLPNRKQEQPRLSLPDLLEGPHELIHRSSLPQAHQCCKDRQYAPKHDRNAVSPPDRRPTEIGDTRCPESSGTSQPELQSWPGARSEHQ